MAKLTVLKGLPASGKTTYAKDLVAKSGAYGRINRDDLRAMIFNSKWTRDREKIIIECEKAIAEVLLESDHSVIVDDTNFKNVWPAFSEKYPSIKYEEKKFDTSVEECIERDKKRLASVGANVIRKMAARNGLIQWPELPIVLVDIDGTLSDGSHREHFVKGDKKDWDSYFDQQENDRPITHVFKWVAELAKDHTIVIVSGRGAEREESTLRWFKKIWEPNPLFPELDVPRFPVFQWFFRDAGDRRPDTIIKMEVLKLLPTKPVMVIDDRPSVVKAWREHGLRVVNVKGACEDF